MFITLFILKFIKIIDDTIKPNKPVIMYKKATIILSGGKMRLITICGNKNIQY